jgi:hypothetical protein
MLREIRDQDDEEGHMGITWRLVFAAACAALIASCAGQVWHVYDGPERSLTEVAVVDANHLNALFAETTVVCGLDGGNGAQPKGNNLYVVPTTYHLTPGRHEFTVCLTRLENTRVESGVNVIRFISDKKVLPVKIEYNFAAGKQYRLWAKFEARCPKAQCANANEMVYAPVGGVETVAK